MSQQYTVNVLTAEYNPAIPAAEGEPFKKAFSALPCRKEINKSHSTNIFPNRVYSSRLHYLKGFSCLASLLVDLDTQEFKCIIHGRLKAGFKEGTPQRRRCTNDSDPFQDVPRNVIMFDIDDAKYPPNINPVDNPIECAEFVRDMFPDLQNVNTVVTFSGSAHINLTSVKAHIWFINEKPLSEQQLKDYQAILAACEGVKIDPAVFRTVQPNYTARPLVVGGDPIKDRVIVLDGEESDTADLEIPTADTMQNLAKFKSDAADFVDSPDAQKKKAPVHINTRRGKKQLKYIYSSVTAPTTTDNVSDFLKELRTQKEIHDNVMKAAMYITWGKEGIDKDIFFEAMQQHPRNKGKEKNRFTEEELMAHLNRCLKKLAKDGKSFKKTKRSTADKTGDIDESLNVAGIRAAYDFKEYDEKKPAETTTKAQLKKLLLEGGFKQEHAPSLVYYFLHYFYNPNNEAPPIPAYLSHSEIDTLAKKLPPMAEKRLRNGIARFWIAKEEKRTGLRAVPAENVHKYTGAYLPNLADIIATQPKKPWGVYLASKMGGGKTTQIQKLVKNNLLASCVVITPQVVLSRNIANSMNLDCYLDCTTPENASHRVVSTIHSAHKIDILHNEERQLDILVLEEFSGIMAALHSNIIKGKAAQENAFCVFYSAIIKARIVIVSDANITKSDIDLINKIRGNDKDYLVVMEKDTQEFKKKEPLTVLMGSSLRDGKNEQGAFFSTLEQACMRGERLISAGNRSPIECDKQIAMIEATWCKSFKEGHPRHDEKPKILSIHKDNDGDYEDFFNDPSVALDYDVLIYTPKITSGVSIKDKVVSVPDVTKQQPTHFKHAFFNFVNIGMKASDCIQMLGRYRNDCPITVFIQTINKGLVTDKGELVDSQLALLEQGLTALQENTPLIKHHDEPQHHTPYGVKKGMTKEQAIKIFNAARDSLEATLLDESNKLGIDHISESNRDQNEFADRLLTMLHARFSDVRIKKDVNKSPLFEFTDGVQVRDFEAVRNASILDESEYLTLKQQHTRTRANSYAMTRYEIKKYFLVDDVGTPCDFSAFDTKNNIIKNFYDLYQNSDAMRVYTNMGTIARHDQCMHFENDMPYKQTGKPVQTAFVLMLWKAAFTGLDTVKPKTNGVSETSYNEILTYYNDNIESLAKFPKDKRDSQLFAKIYKYALGINIQVGKKIKAAETKHITFFLELQQARENES